MNKVGKCANCASRRPLIARGLCSRCYADPDIRESYRRQYPTHRKAAAPPAARKAVPDPTQTVEAEAEGEITRLAGLIVAEVVRLQLVNKDLRLSLIRTRDALRKSAQLVLPADVDADGAAPAEATEE